MVGDAILDIWVHGKVERISPEAPVPVFVEERREERRGGAANVIANLEALGCIPSFYGVARSPLKTRFVVNHQQIFRSDIEDCSAITSREEDAIVRACDLDAPWDVLIISDYAKGVCTPSLCQRLIKWAKAAGIKVVVDPKGDDWNKYNGCDLITPNEKEYARIVGQHWLDNSAGLVLTRGGKGISFWRGKWIHIPATNTGPVDVCGCGDTVVAILSAALAVGYDLESAARLANVAAGVVVGKFGTATCSIAELEEAYARYETSSVCVRALQAG